jgi:hypothetical protein
MLGGHHDKQHLLTRHQVRHAEDGAHLDVPVLIHYRLDRGGGDVLTVPPDDITQPVGELEMSAGMADHHVPGAKPVAGQRLCRRVGPVE